MPNRLLSAAACAEIAARAAKATAGPWKVADYNENYPERDTWLGVIQGAFEILEERFQVGRVKYSALPPVENYANAAFIAAARSDIPALLATVAALRETVGVLLQHLPDAGPQEADDWTWAWEELSGASQDVVKDVRRRAAAVYRETA